MEEEDELSACVCTSTWICMIHFVTRTVVVPRSRTIVPGQVTSNFRTNLNGMIVSTIASLPLNRN